jgi:hypothetical protein
LLFCFSFYIFTGHHPHLEANTSTPPSSSTPLLSLNLHRSPPTPRVIMPPKWSLENDGRVSPKLAIPGLLSILIYSDPPRDSEPTEGFEHHPRHGQGCQLCRTRYVPLNAQMRSC